METINFQELLDEGHFLEWWIIASVTKAGALEEVLRDGKEPKNLQVEFIVNGVDLPVKETFKRMKEQDDERILKAAKVMVQDKLNDTLDKVHELTSEIEALAFKKLGVKVEEEEDW